MKSFWVDLIVKVTLPFGTRWVQKQEATILRDGRPLSEWETMWATDVGVKKPEAVRILPVPRVPTPGSWFTRLPSLIFGFMSEGPTGMAVNYGIYLEASQATNPSLLVHELTHVAQFERLGGVEAFLREYLTQCVRDGYWDSDLELEARTAAAPFTRPPGG
ncbi:MAG: hypothetical protein CMO55_15175 [Verrucomicrobiales bacterium]|nr:hypothetical protein [Verrucomicrobiales bacterium]